MIFYDVVLHNGSDRKSIHHVRNYGSKEKIDLNTLSKINIGLANTLRATGLLVGENENAFLDFDKEWVDKARKNELLSMVLSDYSFYTEPEILTSNNPQLIVQQILSDLVTTDYWELQMGGDVDSFNLIDLEALTDVDNATDNENLEVPIGSHVYVRGWNNTTMVYQGRPNNHDLSEGKKSICYKGQVWADESEVILIESFDISKYTSQIETFPLPKYERHNRYFSREKKGNARSYETAAKTQREAKLKLALLIAFRDKDSQ